MTREKTNDSDSVLKALVEHFDDQVRLIGDGHTLLAEKMDGLGERLGRVEEKVERLDVGVAALRSEMRAGDEALREEIRAGDQALREEMSAFRGEVRTELSEFRAETSREFGEVRSMIKLSYAELDARVTRLESALAEVSVRLGRLEKNSAS